MRHETYKFCSIKKKQCNRNYNVVWYICTPTQMKQFSSYEHPVSQKLFGTFGWFASIAHLTSLSKASVASVSERSWLALVGERKKPRKCGKRDS